MKYLNYYKSLSLFYLFIGLFGTGCGEDDGVLPTVCNLPDSFLYESCPDYDPCAVILPANSDFTISGTFFPIYRDTSLTIEFGDGDTSVIGRWTLRAIQEADEYIWRLTGDNMTWANKEEQIRFPEAVHNRFIDISLEVNIIDTVDCINVSERNSTTTKTVFFTRDNLDLRGEYYGRHCNSNEDFFTIGIVDGFFTPDTYLTNFPAGCTRPNGDPRMVKIANNFRKFNLISDEADENLCGQIVGQGEISIDRQTLSFEYTYTFEDGSKEQRCWSGEKL